MFGFKKKVTPSLSVAPKTRNLVAQSGSTLLSTEHRQNLIVKMRRASSVTDKVFQDHYYYALTQAAEFAQAFPASANHHHCHEGGLLDHMLEVAYNATRVCRGFIMPRTLNQKTSLSMRKNGAMLPFSQHLRMILESLSLILRRCIDRAIRMTITT